MRHLLRQSNVLRCVVCILLSGALLLAGCGGAAPDSAPADTTEDDTTDTTNTTEDDVTGTPAAFTLSTLKIRPLEVRIRENVDISVLVTNTGDEAGSYEVELRIDGVLVDSEEVTLAGGASETVSFKASREVEGSYAVTVGELSGAFTVQPPPSLPDVPGDDEPSEEPDDAPEVDDDWVIPEGTGTVYRAVHMGGNWGTNTDAVDDPPEEYFAYLRDLNVNWVGISVAMHLEGSMDDTVELKYENIPTATFSDPVLRNLIQSFRRHGFNVYIHMAIESGMAGEHPVQRWQIGDPFMHDEDENILAEFWPWRTNHPQHEEFVASFWQSYTDCLVHIAQIAEEEGVGMLTLGTETDRLFRSRSGGRWPNHFLEEMQAMVAAVRDVYSGMLGYEMLHFTLINREVFGPGSDYLVQDLDLDFVAVSAYFQLTNNSPNRVMGVEELEAAWEGIFEQHLVPLQNRNPGKPIIFTEFGYTDTMITPFEPSADQFINKIFKDNDGNGLDDGEEAQANCIEAFFNVMNRRSGVVAGAFIWDVMMSTQEQYEQSFGRMRTFNIRGKLAEAIVRWWYDEWF